MNRIILLIYYSWVSALFNSCLKWWVIAHSISVLGCDFRFFWEGFQSICRRNASWFSLNYWSLLGFRWSKPLIIWGFYLGFSGYAKGKTLTPFCFSLRFLDAFQGCVFWVFLLYAVSFLFFLILVIIIFLWRNFSCAD